MLRLEAFLDDKKAAKVLHALDGLVIQLQILPVRNAKTKGGKVVSANKPMTGRAFIMAYLDQLRKAKRTGFKRMDLIAEAQAYGLSKEAVATMLNVMTNEKLVKRKATGVYLLPTTGVTNGQK